MAKNNGKFDLIMLVLCILPFGFDKLYKGDTKMFVIKLLTHLVGIGFIWWLVDVVMLIIDKYQTNPLDYFRK